MNSSINSKTKNSSYVGNGSSFKLTRKKVNDFKFPSPNQVPAGDYISRVVSAKPYTTKSGNEAIEVKYEIKPASTCQKIASGKLPSNTDNPSYNIRQVYPIGTSFFDDYCEAMAEAVGADEVDLADTIGVTEHVTLDYGNASIGGYIERKPIDSEKYDRIFKRSKLTKSNLLEDFDESDDEAENDTKKETEKKTISPVIDDSDDEFDDFLEDDDEED